MKLPKTEHFIQKGIQMEKLINAGGLFTSPTYDNKTVYDLDEALDLNVNQGWFFADFDNVFAGLSTNLWRDLQEMTSRPQLPEEQ